MMGWTALDFACMFNAKAIKILQRHGCEVSILRQLYMYYYIIYIVVVVVYVAYQQ